MVLERTMELALSILLVSGLFVWRCSMAFPTQEFPQAPMLFSGGAPPNVFLSAGGARERRAQSSMLSAQMESNPSDNAVAPMASPMKPVRFGAHCSARKIKAYSGQDVSLRCEMWLPLGSTVIWYNKGTPEVVQKHHQPKENEIQEIGMQQEYHLQTSYYIDCMNHLDQGNYSLEIITPQNEYIRRDFHIKISEGEIEERQYGCCEFCRKFKFLSPRIVEFAKTVVAKAGSELHLPCRREGNRGSNVTWDRTGNNLENGNYSVLKNGDLQIRKLSMADNGFFSCQVKSRLIPVEFEIATYVEVIM